LNAPFEAQRLLELAESWNPDVALPDITLRARPRTARQLSESELDALVEAYAAGALMMELTERFGITRQTIGRRLRSRGVDTSRAEIVRRIKMRRDRGADG
jgi:hypothetical protein